MSSFTSPLDLQTIFVNYFSGSMEIFMFISIIAFAYLGARYRMPTVVFMVLMSLFIVLMAAFGYGGLMVLVILVVGIVAYWVLSKTIKS